MTHNAWRTMMLAVCFLAGQTLAAGAEPASGGALNLEEILVRDVRSFPAACASVAFAGAAETLGGQGPEAARLFTPNPAGPTPVDAFLYVLAIDEIDPATSSFRFEGLGGLVWCDPRLAFDPQASGVDRIRFTFDAVREQLGNMWWPAISMPTSMGDAERSQERLVVFADGTVRLTLKFNARLAARFDYADFPLDRQRLVMPLQSLAYRADQVVIRPAPRMSGFEPSFEIPEWSVSTADTRIVERGVSGGGPPFIRFQTEIAIARKSGFYLWKVAIPVAIVMAVSWSVFWMTRDALGQRQRQSATAILTLVAFQFVVAGFLPRVPYLTFLDASMLWSFCIIASTLLLNVWTVTAFRDNPEIGLRRDRRLRWLYPLLYFAGMVAIFAFHFVGRG